MPQIKTYEIDFGSWEGGRVIKVQAQNIKEAISSAKAQATKQNLSGDLIQAFQVKGSKRKLVWDFMSGNLNRDY